MTPNLVDIPRFDFYGATTRGDSEAEVAEAKRAHDLAFATAAKATPALGTIAAEQAKVDALQAKIDQRAAAEVGKVLEFNALIRDLDAQRESLRLGRERFEVLKAEVTNRRDYLHESCWGASEAFYDTNGHPAIISKWYGVLAGVERALEDFPNWEAAKVQRVAQMETEAAAFAKLHGIKQ